MNNAPNPSSSNEKRIADLERRIKHLERLLGQEDVADIMRRRRLMSKDKMERLRKLDEIRAHRENRMRMIPNDLQWHNGIIEWRKSDDESCRDIWRREFKTLIYK